MTVLVGLKHEGAVYIGTDSIATFEWDIALPTNPKVFRNGEFLIAGSGSARLLQLLRYAFTPPVLLESVGSDDLTRYMVVEFVEAMRRCINSSGLVHVENSIEDTGSNYLVGVRGRLFMIGSDYLVLEESVDYLAAGMAANIAMGVLYATEGMPPEQRVQCALDASERFCAGVRGPFNIECLPAPKKAAK